MTSRCVRLLLVRHGESTWNAVRRWQGQADPPLSELGERQARAAAAQLHRHGPFDAIITSHLRRSRRTGELLARAGGTELGRALPGFAERYAGPWQGLTRIEIEERFPGYLESGRRPDGYESDASIVSRVRATMSVLAREHVGARLLVVSHGGVINALERHLDDERHEWRRVENLEGRWFEHEPLRMIGDRVRLVDAGDESATAPSGADSHLEEI